MARTFRRLGRAVAIAVLAVAGMGVLYFAAAVAGALIRPEGAAPAAGDRYPVTLVWSEIHTDIILPVKGLTVDWTDVLADPDSPVEAPDGGYAAFGWGSETFYRDVPTFDDMTPGIVARALFLDRTVVHVAPVADPERIPPALRRTVQVSAEGLRALEGFILATLIRDGTGRADALEGATYGYGDAFFRAHGRYNPFRTCNQWTSEALRLAGVSVGIWTPFSQSIVWVLGTDAEVSE